MIPPRIFNDKGAFVEPDDVSGLNAATLERLDGVRSAYGNLKAANDAEQAAVQAINDCLEAAKEAEDYRSAHFPPSTPHDEWIINFGNSEQRRQLAERRKGK
jgi:hypothetical protein